MTSSKFDDKNRVLAEVTGIVSEGKRFAGMEFLYYSNPEIIDRVVALYSEEVSRKVASQPLPPDASSDGYGEYLMFLGNIAESTFDPRIYETVLLGYLSGGFRHLYLATVNTERTLDVLFDAKPGPHGRIQRGANTGMEGHPDYFYHRELGGISVVGAYEILSLMVAQSPETLRTNRTQVFSFIAKHAKHFATPQTRSNKPEPVYFQWYDYRVRSEALDVMEFLGTSAEVKLVEELIYDARDVEFEKYVSKKQRKDQFEQIRQKGRRIIAQIQGGSPSRR